MHEREDAAFEIFIVLFFEEFRECAVNSLQIIKKLGTRLYFTIFYLYFNSCKDFVVCLLESRKQEKCFS